jgi:hypothetical protein
MIALHLEARAQEDSPPNSPSSSKRAGDSFVTQEVRSEIERWKTINKIDIDSAAARKIEGGFTSGSYAKPSLGSAGKVAAAYLYEVRDTNERFGMGRGMIVKSDLDRVPLTTFLQSVSFKKEIGYLRVLSTPANGEIIIDGKSSGKTIREFVLSPGKYLVQINTANLHCEEHIEVVKDASAEVTCPKKH